MSKANSLQHGKQVGLAKMKKIQNIYDFEKYVYVFSGTDLKKKKKRSASLLDASFYLETKKTYRNSIFFVWIPLLRSLRY